MQDRFKFRYLFDKKLYEVVLIDFKFNNIYLKIDDKYPLHTKFDDRKLVQCTGLKDKNGKLIYEGDIVKIWKFSKDLFGNDKRVIKWNGARCGFRLYTIDEYKRGMELCPQSMVNVTTIEVIGNVYENSELLEIGINNDR